MRRIAQAAFGAWFAISMTMAQSCVAPSQSASSYSPGGQASTVASHSPNRGSASTNTQSTNSTFDAAAGSTETHIDTSGYTADQGESRALTDYLTQHKLPLVGAQVLKGSGAKRAIVLYGFVGSDFGKFDAAIKAQRYLADQSVVVDNRIKVRPELLASSGGTSGEPGSGSSRSQPDNSGYPGPQSYVQQQNNDEAIRQYQQTQSSAATMSTVVPLIALLGVLGMGLASGGGGFAVGPGSLGPPSLSPFGSMPYNPYPGYGSPYGSSPYGVPPYGGSPYGVPPSSPYYP
jgi:hypothetical protein